jgi:hypothetical protein
MLKVISGQVTLSAEKQLFNYYYNLMSIEYREQILGYENFEMPNTLCSIKVNFNDDSWIRVYRKVNGTVEWY